MREPVSHRFARASTRSSHLYSERSAEFPQNFLVETLECDFPQVHAVMPNKLRQVNRRDFFILDGFRRLGVL